MRRLARAGWLFALIVLTGCAENSLVLRGQLENLQQQQLALSRQNRELQSRAGGLDRDNQELEALLAQTRQRAEVLEDQLDLVRDQLSGVTAQLARARQEKEESDKKAQALTASLHRQGGVTIRPNNSFLSTLPAVQLPDVHVRRDGDLVRIELPGSKLFEPGTAQLRADGIRLIENVAAELLGTYPNQMIGVEGHTDSDPMHGGPWRNSVHLTAAQALAVHDVLLNRTRLSSGQLFALGHGANHPIASNGTAAGKDRNRRVELVVYPERARR